MKTIKLNSEVSLSAITQGMWRLTSWNLSTDELVQFMNNCIELGVTSFDTAELYGDYHCEEEMGKAIKANPKLRSKIQIITKTGINKPKENNSYTMAHYETRYEKIMSSCQKSLENLNTDYINLFLIHREDPMLDIQEVAKAFKELLEKGMVKAVGVSNFNPRQFSALQKACGGVLVCNQIEVSPLQFEHFNNDNMFYLQEEGVHPMYWSPLAGGQIFTSDSKEASSLRNVLEELAKKYQCEVDTLVYAWLLKHPVNGIAISGSSKIDRLKNAIKGSELELEHEDWYRIYTASHQQILR